MTDLPLDESGTAPDEESKPVFSIPLMEREHDEIELADPPDVDVVPASDEQIDAIEREADRAPADPPAFPHVALSDGDTATAMPMGDEPHGKHSEHGGHRVKRHIIHNGKDYHPGDTIDTSADEWDDDSVADLKSSGALEADTEHSGNEWDRAHDVTLADSDALE